MRCSIGLVRSGVFESKRLPAKWRKACQSRIMHFDSRILCSCSSIAGSNRPSFAGSCSSSSNAGSCTHHSSSSSSHLFSRRFAWRILQRWQIDLVCGYGLQTAYQSWATCFSGYWRPVRRHLSFPSGWSDCHFPSYRRWLVLRFQLGILVGWRRVDPI